MSRTLLGTSLVDQLGVWSDLLGTVLAGVAIAIGLGSGTIAYQAWKLRRLRRRTIGRALALQGRPVERRRFAAITSQLLEARLRRPQGRVVDELNWLGNLLDVWTVEHEHDHRWKAQLPVAFASASADAGGPMLDAVAEAYRQYAALLRRKWILRSAAGPLVGDEYELALATADALSVHARQSGPVAPPDPAGIREAVWIDCRSAAEDQRVRLLAWPDVTLATSPLTFSALATSYVPFRVVTKDAPGAKNVPDGVTVKTLPVIDADRRREQARRESGTAGREFDGVMTRIHGPGWRMEVDPYSGRQRLHLCLSETSFFAFRATQRIDGDMHERGEDAFCSRLLSVNLILIDDREHAVLVRRHPSMTHGGVFAGAVSGACEVVAREGLSGDVDGHGVPDPLHTVVREAQEELGLDISGPEWKLSTLGLVQVETSNDMGTYVFTATARLQCLAENFSLAPGTTDDIEGTWELGGDSMVVDLPAVLESQESLTAFVRWARSSSDMVAHGVGALLLLLVVRLAKDGAGKTSRLGATLQGLAEALSEPVRDSPQPRTVTMQPLWAAPEA